MNNVLEKGNIIAKIRKGEDLDQIIDYVKSEIYRNGPNSSVVLEIVSYFKLFQPEFFKKYEQEIIATMGLFSNSPKLKALKDQSLRCIISNSRTNSAMTIRQCKQIYLGRYEICSISAFQLQQVQENHLCFDILFLNVLMMWLLLFHQGHSLTSTTTD